MKLLILALFLTTSAEASTYLANGNEGEVAFTAKGKPALISIKGIAPGPQGQIAFDGKKLSGEFKLNLSQLNTGIELRDEHMKNKYLEVSKFPESNLIIHQFEVSESQLNQFEFEATLRLHGVEKRVKGSAIIENDGQNKNLSAELKVNLKAFNIDIPNFQGITVAEEVAIKVTTPLILKAETK